LPPLPPSPPPPSPSPPPYPPLPPIEMVNFETDLTTQQSFTYTCSHPEKQFLTYAGDNGPAYPLLFSVDPTLSQGASCQTTWSGTSFFKLMPDFSVSILSPVRLAASGVPPLGAGIPSSLASKLGTVQDGSGQYYLTIDGCMAWHGSLSSTASNALNHIGSEYQVFKYDTGEVFRPFCGVGGRRRLAEDEDDEALPWTSHPTGNGRKPAPAPTPSPSPEPLPDSESVQGDPANDLDAWWNNLELSRREGELYARRALPGASGRSAAASVAVAITLAHPKLSVLAGQRPTLDAACHALGGCEQGDYWTSIHERSDADVNEDTRDPKHLPIDDAGWALQLLSRAIEPAVHSVIEGMLVCLSPALCASHCDVCNEWVGLGNGTAEAVLRETELRLHASTKQASRSVLHCVASFECLSEVATEVAEQLGDARELPATVRMAAVAKANFDLLEGARAEARQNSSWQVRRPARFALLRDHVAAVKAHEQAPLGEDDEVAEAGRRLAERPPPPPPPLTPIQEMMKVATNETCRQLALKNSTGAHDSHIQATHLWMVRPLLDPTPTARAHTRTRTRTRTPPTPPPHSLALSTCPAAATTRAVKGGFASTAISQSSPPAAASTWRTWAAR
jgi:hypothetical protein